ncbi:MAG: hypothetical protein ABEJ48_02010 [Halobacteriales archaeon]
MREPNEKEVGSFGNEFLVKAVRNWLRWQHGTRLTEPRPCPDCGDQNYRKHDFKDTIFAILITEEGFEKIRVEYRRFWCKNCEKPISADLSPLFYEDCLYGKPIVNLCLALAAEHSPTKVEEKLQKIGIQVDKDTVANYVEEFGENFAERHGITVADEALAQNILASLFDVTTVEELKEEYAEELAEAGIDEVAGCADETYPAKKGAKKELYEENMERKQEGEQPRPHPEGFTVGLGYLPQLDCFTSVQCRETAFASVLANALGMPMEGVAYCVTDDEDCYNDTFVGRVKCLFHRLCARARGDERVKELHEEGRYEELEAYLESEYEALYEEEVEKLKAEYPSFWNEETREFTGPVTTNAIEGGNWRVKEKLGVPYRRCRSARGRVLLGALSDSLSVYRNGRPQVSFAQRHGTFSFEKIMADQSSTPSNPVTAPPAPPVSIAAG